MAGERSYDVLFNEFARGLINRYSADKVGNKGFQLATNVVFRDEQAKAIDKGKLYTDVSESVNALYAAGTVPVNSIYKANSILGLVEVGNAYATFTEHKDIVYFSAPSLTHPTKTADAINYYKLGITAPTVAPTVSASGAGACTTNNENFGYTYYSSTFDHESMMSPLSGGVTLAANTALVTVTAHGTANEHVDKIKVYISLAASGIYYKAKEVSNATAGVTVSQAYSAALPVYAGERNEPPPQLTGLIGPYNDHMIGWSGKYLYLSVADQFNGWPSTGYTWEFPLPIIGARLFRNVGVLVWTAWQTYLFSGPSVERMVFQPISNTVGLVFSHACCMTDYGMAWLSRDGVALYNGDGVRIITPKVLSDDWFTTNLYATGTNVHFGYIDQQLLVFTGSNSKAVVVDFFNYPTLCITQTDYAGNVAGTGISSNPERLLYLRNDSGDRKAYEWAKSGGTQQTMVIHTGEVTPSAPGKLMNPRRLMLDFDGGPFTFELYANGSSVDSFTSTTHATRGEPQYVSVATQVYASRMSVKVTGKGTVYAIGILDVVETEAWR